MGNMYEKTDWNTYDKSITLEENAERNAVMMEQLLDKMEDGIYKANRPFTNGTVEVSDTPSVEVVETEEARTINVKIPVTAGGQGPQGEQGIQGPKGDPGPQGIQGIPGPAGPTGPQGEQGLPGAAGIIGPKGDTGATGLTGPQGEQGPKGDQGLKGETGLTGPKGDKGDPGVAGVAGPKGETGLTGPKGDKGDPGVAGADGKSAYESAKAGGYTGTETEFNTKLSADGVDPNTVPDSAVLNSSNVLEIKKGTTTLFNVDLSSLAGGGGAIVADGDTMAF